MLVANGYFDGDSIKTFENFKAQKNQKVIITVLDEFVNEQKSAFGLLKDKIIKISDDFDAPLDEFKDYE
nr:DUF2281 domain-containing protein [uncultured Campylobacter sp.]